MIQIYDYYNQNSRDLHYSLSQAGYDGRVLVINEDGFLPDGVTSPYAYFCQMEGLEETPCFFNQLPIPAFWEISGTNAEAQVWDYDQLRARIFYAEPKNSRFVKNVDWLDRTGKVLMTDHYNKAGWVFAQTYFDDQEKPVTKTYVNAAGQEVVTENFRTGDIILTWQGQQHFFANRVELLNFYLEMMGWDGSNLVYNSLSTPFFYAYHSPVAGQDFLFWQEELGNELPGNMAALLQNQGLRRRQILVQDRQTYERLLSLVSDEEKAYISHLGLIYPQRRSNLNRKTVMVLTNSDQVEGLDELSRELTDFTFHIAALTEMSQRLTAFDNRDNVKLYPNISQKNLDGLYASCDVYLDINHGDEVLQTVRRAFEENMLLLGFEETVHDCSLILADHIFSAQSPQLLVQRLRAFADELAGLADIQQAGKGQELVPAYRQLLGGHHA